jgi:hypothetical protein
VLREAAPAVRFLLVFTGKAVFLVNKAVLVVDNIDKETVGSLIGEGKMKKFCFLFGLLIYLSVGGYAETSISLGIGGEADQYSQNGLGGGFTGTIDYRFGELFSVGERSVYSLDFGEAGLATLELGATLRLYFLRFKKLLDYYYIWQRKYHWFLQVDAGGAWVYQPDTSKNLAWSDFMLGGCAGVRIVFGEKDRFYLEPYIRFSNTSHFGAGALFGMSFYANPR